MMQNHNGNEEMKRKLTEISDSFLCITNTTVTIYDRERNIICTSAAKFNRFCTYLRTAPEMEERCIAHDNEAFDVCDRTHAEYRYHCHMGLVEVARPIVQDGIVLGYILFGQITNDDAKSLPLERIAACKTTLDREKLRSNLASIRVIPDETIKAMSKLLETSVAYILMNHLLSLKSGSMAYKVASYIRENYRNKISSSTICSQFYLSRTSLFYLSREYFGCSINEYILRFRMEKAKKLLEEGILSVGDIAASVGINDIHYFSRVFRRYYHAAPVTFKKSNN